MFSTAQMDILKPLVAQMRDNGYLYYLAVQNTATGVSNDYDMFIYFSDTEITALSQYSYSMPQSTIKYSIRSGNASTNQKQNRIDITYLTSATTLRVDSWQFCSTNAETISAMVVPDLTFTEVKSYETAGLSSFMLTVIVLLVSILHFFRG